MAGFHYGRGNQNNVQLLVNDMSLLRQGATRVRSGYKGRVPTPLHRAFTRSIWRGIRQGMRTRSGLATMMPMALAREVATF